MKVMLIPKNYPAKYSFNGTLVYFNGKLVDKYDWSDPYYFIAGKLFDIDNPGHVQLYQLNRDNKGKGKVSFDATEWDTFIGEDYASGKSITIHAKPDDDSVFIGWERNDEETFVSTDADFTITTPDGDVTDKYYAYFERKFPATGTVNSSVDYTFDSATGTMTFIPTKDDGEGHKTGSLTGFSYYSSSTDRSPIFCTTKVKHIVIEEGITEIGSYFVYESKNVEDISIPATVVGISSDAFSGSKIGEFIVASESESFTTLNGSLFSKDKTKMIRYASTIDGLDFIVPDGVTVIQRDCFEKADFNTVTLKGEGLCLEDYALRCSYKHLIISEGVKELGDYSSTPSEDTVITLPASLRYVGNQGIINSEKCTEIKVAEGNETYKSIDGVLYVINSDETLSLHKYPVGKTESSFTTPKQVKKIGWCAIRSQKYLKDITITENVEKIDGGAMEYLEDATVTIQNPDCEIALDAFEFNTNLTLKGLKGSTAFTYAKGHGINFICTGEDLGKLSAPTNIRWEGTKVKWNPIENARYNVKFYRNESGSWDHVTSEDKVIADGSCEIDYKTLMWYKDAGYKIVISASKLGYDDSDEAESPVASGLFNRGSFDAQIDGDTILAPFDIGDNTDYRWFSYYVIFYDETNTEKYSSWFHIDSKDEYPNLREILASKNAPYGKYKVYVSKNIEYYGWTVGIASSNDKVEYNYQSIPKVIKVELDIPDPIHGEPAPLTSGLKVKTYCGENVLDALGKSTQYYENCYQYKEDDSSSWTGFEGYDDAKVIKGKYQYAYYLILKAKTGYEISEDINLLINGEPAKSYIIEKSSSLIKLRYEFPIGTKVFEYIDAATITGDYDKPMIGKDIKDPENVQVEEKGLSINKSYWVTKEGSEWKNEKVTGKFEAGKEYAIYVDLKVNEDDDFLFASTVNPVAFGDSSIIWDYLNGYNGGFYKVVGKAEAEPTPTPTSEPTAATPTPGTTDPTTAPTPGANDPAVTPTPGADAPSTTPTAEPAGTILEDTKGKAKYKVLSEGVTDSADPSKNVAPTVEYTGTTNKKAKKLSVPDTVKLNGVIYNVEIISAGALKNNKKITSVTIGKNVKEIKKNAFAGCTALKTVNCKSKVLQKIGANAFKGDKKLTTIKLVTTKLKKKSVGSNAIKGTSKKLKIKAPKKVKKSYQKIFSAKGNKKVKVK